MYYDMTNVIRNDDMKKILFLCAILGVAFLLAGCPSAIKPEQKEKEVEDINTVTVNFFNESSFKADVYMNVNPSSIDTSTDPIATVPAGATETVKLPASKDQIIGDVFYIRYFIQLADGYHSGTAEPGQLGKTLYVQAERDLSNITFVLEKDKSYTKTILQPASGQLKFTKCYIKVQNIGNKSFKVLQGSTYLKKLGTEELNLASGQFGFYELSINHFANYETISSLIFWFDDATSIKADPFLLERGKVYSFQCNETEVTAPAVTDITY